MQCPVISLAVLAAVLAVTVSPVFSQESSPPILAPAKRAAPVLQNEPTRRVAPVAQPQTSGPSLLLEAIRWTGATIQQVSVPSNSECAELLNLILGKTGRGITPSGAVRLILEKYGKQLDGVRMGALVVLTRGRNVGIIGIVRGTDGAGNPIVISGHHGNKVSESIYSTNKVLGYFMPDKCGGSSAR